MPSCLATSETERAVPSARIGGENHQGAQQRAREARVVHLRAGDARRRASFSGRPSEAEQAVVLAAFRTTSLIWALESSIVIPSSRQLAGCWQAPARRCLVTCRHGFSAAAREQDDPRASVRRHDHAAPARALDLSRGRPDRRRSRAPCAAPSSSRASRGAGPGQRLRPPPHGSHVRCRRCAPRKRSGRNASGSG